MTAVSTGVATRAERTALVTLRPGALYDSVNYRWFCENFDDFLYLDRIMVSDHARRRGIATLVYDAMENHVRCGMRSALPIPPQSRIAPTI